MGRKAKAAPPAVRPVVGYTRVSTEGQKDGVSLREQEDCIRHWAASKGYTVARVESDVISGGKADRPGLKRALEAVTKQRGVLVVYSLSRMTRSLKHALDVADALNKAGADLVSLNDGEAIDTTSATGKMVFQLLNVVNEFLRNSIGERTRAALAYKKSKGERTGKVPYGYRVGPDGRTLQVDPQERQTVKLIHGLRRKGLRLREIADELKRRGVRNRVGNDEWTLPVISELVKRPLPGAGGRSAQTHGG